MVNICILDIGAKIIDLEVQMNLPGVNEFSFASFNVKYAWVQYKIQNLGSVRKWGPHFDRLVIDYRPHNFSRLTWLRWM